MNAPHPLPAVTTPPQHFIGNRWVAPAGGETLPMIDPSAGTAFAQIARGTAADIDGALAAGNACVVKPAEDACLSLLRVAELAAEAGLPEGALNIVTGLGREAGAALAAHTGVEHLSFTGSPATGAWVAQEAAKRHCPVTLELGGEGPQIIFVDADLDTALPGLVNAIVQNAGQACSAGSRFLAERSGSDEVPQRL